MGTYEQLKAAVAAVIHDNGAEEITGNVMQNVLITLINSLGAGATFAGVAVPTTNPSSPDAKMFYLAGKAGTYTNFNLTITKGLWVFENTTGSWVGHDLEVSMLFASGQDVTSTNIAATYAGAGNNDLVTVGAMDEALAGIVGSVALSALDSTRTAGLYRVIGVQSRVVGYLQVNMSLSWTYVIQFLASDIFDFDDGYTADYKGHILTRSYNVSAGTWSAWDEYGGGKFASGEKVADVSIAQTLGNSQTSVASQKAVTDAIYNLIDIANIDAMKNDATLRTGGTLARYTATTTLQGVTYKVGILDVMSDSAGHVLTQILTTHYTITSGVLDTSSHSDGAVRQYYRSVKINGGTLPTTDWTLWKPINDEQLDVLSAAVDAVKASVGYYVCDTAAGTAAKVVSATGYELTTGGCIRIKMDNANTADSVTLNINSTGAKALYYEGVQASSTNGWKAGEVLEVYYDGTQYQCASGGGGKFATGQKVKDVSITDTLNQTASLVESQAVYNVIGGDGSGTMVLDMSQVAEIGYYPNSNGKWIAYNSYKSKIVPVPAATKKISVTARSTYNATVVLLKSGTVPTANNTPIDYADSNSYFTIPLGTTMEISIPSNCTHLGVGTYTSVVNEPTITCYITKSVAQQIQELGTRIDGIDDEILELNDAVTVNDLIEAVETFDNVILDNGSTSTNSSTKDKYISKKYAIADGVAYKITSKVRGSGYHQLLFKDANGNVTGLINDVTQEVVLQTVIDSNNIPANSVYFFVNGYVYDGSTIEARLDVPVKDMVGLVPNIAIDVEELNGTVFGTDTQEEEIPPTEMFKINNVNNRVYIDYRGTIKDGDRIVFNGGTSYAAYIGITNTAGTSFEKNYTNGGYVNSLDIVYNDGNSRYIRFLVKKSDDAAITIDEVVANTTFQILRTVSLNGLVAEVDGLKNKKPNIKALFIGNSVCQDHVAYLPWLLKNTFGNDINFEIYLAYKGGATIKQYVTEIITGTTPLDIFSLAANTESWSNSSNFLYADIWTLYGPFDLICFEGYFNHGTSSAGLVEDTSYFMPFINDLKTRQTQPFKLGYLIHQTYTTTTHTEADAWARIIAGAEFAIQNTPVSILFPCGVVTKLVNGDIPQATLTNDDIHNQQGLPCIMGAYTLVEELTRYMGLPSVILNNPLRITSEIETALNIPGPNGSLQVGTELQYSLCQDAAVNAVKYGDWLMLEYSDILNN